MVISGLTEEQQIQDFVHRVSGDQAARHELALDPVGMIGHAGYSARVTAILLRLVACLDDERQMSTSEKWWHA